MRAANTPMSDDGVTPDFNSMAKKASTRGRHKITRVMKPAGTSSVFNTAVASVLIGATLGMASVASAATIAPNGDIIPDDSKTTVSQAMQNTFGAQFADSIGGPVVSRDALVSPFETAAKAENTTPSTKTVDKVVEEDVDLTDLGNEIISGNWGNGAERVDALTRAYDANVAQAAQDYVDAVLWGVSPVSTHATVRRVQSVEVNANDTVTNQNVNEVQTQAPANYKSKVWVVDKEGYWEVHSIEEPLFVNKTTPAVTETVTIPGEATTVEHPAEYKTVTVTDKDAWDEVVEDTPAHTIYHDPVTETVKVLKKAAWTETVVDKEGGVIEHPAEYKDVKVIDKEAWDEVVTPEQTIHHEAEYKDVKVVDQEAWDEKVIDVPGHTIEHPAQYEDVKVVDSAAWDEVIPAVTKEVVHPAVTETKQVLVTPEQVIEEPVYEMQTVECVVFADGYKISTAEYNAMSAKDKAMATIKHGHWTIYDDTIQVQVGTKKTVIPAVYDTQTVVVTPEWTETVVVTPEHTVHHPEVSHIEKKLIKEAWTETVDEVSHIVHHPEVSHIEKQLVKEAWDETIPAVIISHPEVSHIEKQLIKEAWTETIETTYKQVEHPAVYEDEIRVITPGWEEFVAATYKVIHHEAETHEEQVLVKDAWIETIPGKDTTEVRVITPETTERVQVGTRTVNRRVWIEPVGHWEYKS